MKKSFLFSVLMSLFALSFAQVDTISTEIYQKDGKLGIGTINPDIKVHIIDSGNQILLGYQPLYDGPYINIHGSLPGDLGPMLGLGVARKEYYKDFDTLTMINWAYIYGDNLNPGIAILPDLQFASKGLYIKRDGKIGINTKHPITELDVNGGIKIGYSMTSTPGLLRFNGSDFEGFNGTSWLSLTRASDSLWQNIDNNISYMHGKVGIGTTNPDIKVHIIDSNNQILLGYQPAYDGPYINIHGSMPGELGPMIGIGVARKEYYKDFDTLTMINWAYIYGDNLNPGIAILPDLQFASKGLYIKRDGKIGINIKQPKAELDVNGGIKIGFSVTNVPGILRFTGSDFEGYNGTSWVSFSGASDSYWQKTTDDIFYAQGNVGIGTEQPSAKLEVTDGDIFISDIGSGIIMKSPDGTCWRGTLDNSGSLNFVSISCPDVSPGLKESEEGILKQAVSIYPNPAKDQLYIEVNDKYDRIQYSVFNISGNLVQSGKIKNNTRSIDISKLVSGTYLFEFKDLKNNKIATYKIIKD
jgi:hypothetical protein